MVDSQRKTARLRGLPWPGGMWLGFVSVLLACSESHEPDKGPDMQWLVDQYDHPTAEINPEDIQDELSQAVTFLASVRLMDNFTFLTDAMQATKQGFEVRGIDFDGEIPVVGSASVDALCPGVDPDQAPDAELDGRVALQVPIEDGGLGPVAFGDARHCRFTGDTSMLAPYLMLPGDLLSRSVEVDGEVNVHLGDKLTLGQTIELKPLVQILGTVDVEGLPTLKDFDFRIPSPYVSETRIVLPSGKDFIVFSDELRLGIREQRGTWLCDDLDLTACLPDF